MKERNREQAYTKGLHTQIRGHKDYIRSQNNTITHLQGRIEEIKKEIYGTRIVIWNPYEATQQCSDLELGNLSPNDRIAIIGRVKHVQAWAEKGCDNLHSQITYEVLETRRIGS